MSRKFHENIASNRRGRECALQLLFEVDALPADKAVEKLDEVFMQFWMHLDPETAENAGAREYAERAVRRVVVNRAVIDEAIQSRMVNWRLDRIDRVDRSILRLGAYELLFAKLQTAIGITQAVELAKTFGTEESGSFVNAVLDRVSTLRKPREEK